MSTPNLSSMSPQVNRLTLKRPELAQAKLATDPAYLAATKAKAETEAHKVKAARAEADKAAAHKAAKRFWDRAPEMRARRGLRFLKAKFPACFCSPPRPLKLKIQKDVCARYGTNIGFRFDVSCALAVWCSRPDYVAARVIGADRVDLDGNVCGTVTPSMVAKVGADEDLFQ